MPAKSTIDNIELLLRQEPHSVKELEEETGLSVKTLYECFNALNAQGILRKYRNDLNNRVYYTVSDKRLKLDNKINRESIEPYHFNFRGTEGTLHDLIKSMVPQSFIAKLPLKLAGSLSSLLLRTWMQAYPELVEQYEQETDSKFIVSPPVEVSRETILDIMNYMQDFAKVLNKIYHANIWMDRNELSEEQAKDLLKVLGSQISSTEDISNLQKTVTAYKQRGLDYTEEQLIALDQQLDSESNSN